MSATGRARLARARKIVSLSLVLCIAILSGVRFGGIPQTVRQPQSGGTHFEPFSVSTPFVDNSAQMAAGCTAVATCNTVVKTLTWLGDAVFAVVATNLSGAINAVQDNYGNSLALLQSSAGTGNLKISVYEEYNFPHLSAQLWANVSAPTTYSIIMVAVAGVGVSPVDVLGVKSTGHSTAVSASATTVTANDLVLLAIANGGSGTVTASGGDSVVKTLNVNTAAASLLDQTDASTGAFAESATTSVKRDWVAFLVGLKLGTVPAAPTALAQTGATWTTVTIGWTAPHGAIANYSVYKYSGATCSSFLTGLNSVSTSLTVTISTGPGSTTSYKVTAFNSTGESAPTSCVSAETIAGPPTGPSASPASTTSILVSWTNPSGTLSDSYVFWQLGFTCPSATRIDVGSVVTSYTVTGLTTGTTYCFYVQAVDAGGVSNSSAIVTATTAQVPGAPTGLTVVSVTASSISASWTNPSSAGQLNNTVYYVAGACGTSFVGLSTSGAATSFSIPSLAQATAYCVRVSLWNATGQSPASTSTSGTTLPTPPTGLVLSAVTSTSVTLSWTNPSGGTLANNTVYYGASCAGPSWTGISVGVSTTYTVTGLTRSTFYCFQVTAWSAGGQSVPGAPGSTTTLTGLPNPPQNLSLIAETVSTLTLSWRNPAGPLVNVTFYYRAGACGAGAAFTGVSVGIVSTTTLTNLPPAATFSVEVAGWNTTGQGVLSNCLTVTTDPFSAAGLFNIPPTSMADWTWILVIATVLLALGTGFAWSRRDPRKQR